MALGGGRGTTRVLDKLENSVKNGNYYEAHQMYRTLYFRYLGQKKFDELLSMLYDGSILFLNHDQNVSGADLALLLVDTLVKSGNTQYIEWTPKLCKILSKIHPSTPERDTFITNAIRWSSSGGKNSGHPYLHQHIAQIYWNEKNYAKARHHFIYSKDGHGCAKLLIEFQTNMGYRCEVDLFIAQAVLQYLCLSNKITANQSFTSYTQHHPSIQRSGPPYLFPLLNFIWFLLQAIESQKLQTFAVLCERYELSIRRDPCYVQYLDKIGQIFFGVKPPKQQRGFFGNFLDSFLGSLDDDSEDEVPQPSTSSATLIETTELD